MPTRIDPVRLEAWRVFLTAHARLVDRLDHELKEHAGIPLTWYEVLLRLYESEGNRLRMHEMAESLLLSRSAATRFVERMERAGLVERSPCESDRRGTFVTLTDEGAAVFRRAGPRHLRGLAEHFAGLVDADEAATMTAALRRIVRALGDQPDG
jgi:DNA-binding MarR family transcriptional regulator